MARPSTVVQIYLKSAITQNSYRSSRYEELAEKYKNGTITPAEMQEAQHMVDHAAKKAGYYHKTLYRGDRPGKTEFTGGLGEKGLRIPGNIFLFDDPKLAKFYTSQRTNYMRDWSTMGPEEGLYALKADLGTRVLTMDAKDKSWLDVTAPKELGGKARYPRGIQIDDLAAEAKKKGYTALVVKNVGDQAGWGTQYVVFSPTQIKSAAPFVYQNGKLVPLEERFYKVKVASQSGHIPKALQGLAAEARKYDTFEEFEDAFLREIKHGTYWHWTDDPNFKIDPSKGPRDMSSLSTGRVDTGKLMVTSHLRGWSNYGPGGKGRPYAALIDMSDVPKNAYYQVRRGFGNEFYVSDPSKDKVIAVYPRSRAFQVDRERHNALPQSSEELEEFYYKVKSRDLVREEKEASSALESALRRRGVRGDALLDAVDLAETLREKGGIVDENGVAVLYHRTTPENAEAIVREQRMTSKEDGLFFSTRPIGQIEGYGKAVVRVKVPVEKLELDDEFADECHVRMPTGTIGKKIPVQAYEPMMHSANSVGGSYV